MPIPPIVKLDYRQPVEYKIQWKDHLPSAFKNGKLPSNAYIRKGRCGIGGTTMEIKCSRNSIIIVPNVSIITGKKIEFPELGIIGVCGKIKSDELAEKLKQHNGYYKIFVTPDSFYKVIDALEAIGVNPYRDFFCLIDEVHTLVSALSFREKMIDPLRYFFSFREKSVITATPWEFSDVRFSMLQVHLISFTDKPRFPVKIVYANNVLAGLKKLIADRNDYPGNLHIFYSNVTGMKDILDISDFHDLDEITRCVNLFVSDDPDNKEKLDEYEHLRASVGDTPKKVNIYTSKFAEGFDLRDNTKVTMVIATDPKVSSTIVGIHNTAIQFIGRLRYKGNNHPDVIHITNIKQMVTDFNPNEIYQQKKEYANACLMIYNLILMSPGINEEVRKEYLENQIKTYKPYLIVDPVSKLAEISPCKLDVFVNDAMITSQHASEYNMSGTWYKSGYKPEVQQYDKSLSKADKRKLGSNAKDRRLDYKTNAEIISTLLDAEQLNEHDKQYLKELKQLKKKIYDAVKFIGIARMRVLGFDERKINKEVKGVPVDTQALFKLLSSFPLHIERDNEVAKQQLQEVLDTVGKRDKRGEIETATTTKLEQYFEIERINTTRDSLPFNGVKLVKRKFRVA